MSVSVKFKIGQIWREFYLRYNCQIDNEPNDSGWVNFPCVLPTHNGSDKHDHGGVNLYDGRYKCWSGTCREAYAADSEKESLSASEFLMLVQGLDRQQANEIVESYRLESVPASEVHLDTTTTAYSPQPEWIGAVKTAQQALNPDLEIVREYLASRGLRYETLEHAGVGYLPGPPEALIHPYIQGGTVVGIRARSFDGRKGGVSGSHATLYQLQSINGTGLRTCILCEGETDTLITRQLLNDYGYLNIPVLGTPGNSFSATWARHLQQFSRVILLAQTDNASRQLARQAKSALQDKLEVIQPPFPAQAYGKDVSDFLRLDAKKPQELIDILGLSLNDIAPLPYVLTPQELYNLGAKSIPWLIPEIIERGTKILLVGEPKSHKTWIALQLVHSITTGSAFMGMLDWTPIETGRALLIEEEGSSYRLGNRLAKIFGNQVADYYVIHRQGVSIDVEESMAKLRHEALRLKPDLIIFDPYASFHTQDENQSRGTKLIMDGINSLLRALPNAAVVIVHHSPKGKDEARGSGALWGAADTQILAKRTDDGTRLAIKGRDLPDEFSSGIEFLFDITTGKHRPIGLTPSQTPPVQKKTAVVRDAIEQLFKASPSKWFSQKDVAKALNLTGYGLRTGLIELVKSDVLEMRGGYRNCPREFRLKGS